MTTAPTLAATEEKIPRLIRLSDPA